MRRRKGRERRRGERKWRSALGRGLRTSGPWVIPISLSGKLGFPALDSKARSLYRKPHSVFT